MHGAPLADSIAPMQTIPTTEIAAFLTGVDVTRFAQDHKLPLRTLVRLKGLQGEPRQATLEAVSRAIAKHRRNGAKATVR